LVVNAIATTKTTSTARSASLIATTPKRRSRRGMVGRGEERADRTGREEHADERDGARQFQLTVGVDHQQAEHDPEGDGIAETEQCQGAHEGLTPQEAESLGHPLRKRAGAMGRRWSEVENG
jgi:hypothetical protein